MPRPKAAALVGDEIKRVMVPMRESVHHRLRIVAAERKITMADIVLEAIERELARLSKTRATA
jgi:hypothetical protein